MAPDRSFNERNAIQRGRLQGILQRVSDADLSSALGDGWTVSAGFAHLAFFDAFSRERLLAWLTDRQPPAAIAPDALNAALLPQWLALPPAESRRLLLESMIATDQQIASLLDESVTAIVDSGQTRLLERSGHRAAHAEAIERALDQPSPHT